MSPTPSAHPKVAIVTGASAGIGNATAQRLMAAGYHVVAAARRVDAMADLAAAGATVLRMDITVEADVEALVQHVEQLGGADVLVNNAGYGLYGAVEDIPIAEARRQFEVNLFGLAHLTQRVLPGMRARGAGTIVNVSSVGGKVYTPLGAWYHATKHALEGWSDALRFEVAPFGVRVVIIEPGGILTEFEGVMASPMLTYSGEGPYGPLAHAMAKQAATMYRSPRISPPSVIADVIARAVQAKRPRTRYAAGHMARVILFLRRWLSDRAFDAVLRSQAK